MTPYSHCRFWKSIKIPFYIYSFKSLCWENSIKCVLIFNPHSLFNKSTITSKILKNSKSHHWSESVRKWPSTRAWVDGARQGQRRRRKMIWSKPNFLTPGYCSTIQCLFCILDYSKHLNFSWKYTIF